MVYAHRKEIYDADSHMMETPDWISNYADPKIRPHLEPFVGGRKRALAEIKQAINDFESRQNDHENIRKPKKEFMSMIHKA